MGGCGVYLNIDKATLPSKRAKGWRSASKRTWDCKDGGVEGWRVEGLGMYGSTDRQTGRQAGIYLGT